MKTMASKAEKSREIDTGLVVDSLLCFISAQQSVATRVTFEELIVKYYDEDTTHATKNRLYENPNHGRRKGRKGLDTTVF